MYLFQYKTPLLQMLSIFYNLTGIPTEPVSLSRPHTIAIWVWNLILNAVIVFVFIKFDPVVSVKIVLNMCQNSKPIFLFFHVCVVYVHPLVYALDSAYLIINAHKIIRLLDLPCFETVYSNMRKSQKIFAMIIIVNHFFVLEFILIKLQFIGFNEPLWKAFLSVVSIYGVCTYSLVNCYVIHYTHHATYCTFKEIHLKLKRKTLPFVEDQVIKQIRELALANNTLNQALSIPNLVFIFISVFNAVLIVSMSLICQVSLLIFICK